MTSTNRVALVTGANQGGGPQVAKELVAAGVTVFAGARDLRLGEAAAAASGPGATALQRDVTDRASIAAAAGHRNSQAPARAIGPPATGIRSMADGRKERIDNRAGSA